MRHDCPEGAADAWAYCADCYDQWIQPQGKRIRGHITFRDKASQGRCKSACPAPGEAVVEDMPPALENARPEDGLNRTEAYDPIEDEETLRDDPEMEPVDFEQAAPDVQMAATEGDMDVDGEDDGALPEALEETPLLPEERLPTLEEYQETWDRLQRQHTRTVRGNFGPNNLVPEPLPQLFQDCPWVLSGKKQPVRRPDILTSTSCGLRRTP